MAKTCKYCGQKKPANRFYKGRAKCKDCLNADKRDLRNGIKHHKSSIRVCRECGVTEVEAKFVKNANVCKYCNRQYMKEYRQKNRGKLSKQIQGWKKKNRARYNEVCRANYNSPEGKKKHKERVERSPRSWISSLFSRIKYKKITLDHVCDLWNKQAGCCAISGVTLTHRFDSLESAVITTIDNNRGFVRGNVQLICQGLSALKKKHTNAEIGVFLESIVDAKALVQV